MNDDQLLPFHLFLTALGINQYANERVLRAAMCAAWEEGFEEGERSTPARDNPYEEKA